MKERGNQLFKDKFVLVMLVLGLLTIVAAAGAVRIQKGRENIGESPYLEIEDPDHVIAGDSNAGAESGGDTLAGELAASGDEAGNGELAGDGTAVGLADNENGTGSGSFSDGISVDTGLADASDGTLTGANSMAEAGAAVSESLVLDFTDTDKLSWPVTGNIVLGYSMDTTTYFPTLDQYKVNPANVIQSEVSTPVSAPADARVVSVGTNEEIGNYVDLDLGNGYTAVCGQLKEIPVVENEYVRQGDLLGYVAEPTKYYAVEGTNVFFEFLKDGVPVDALDFLE
ncbi:MAG: peptidoglycan DD-metalloendopeptidase family protein [Pilosibacter sp.]